MPSKAKFWTEVVKAEVDTSPHSVLGGVED